MNSSSSLYEGHERRSSEIRVKWNDLGERGDRKGVRSVPGTPTEWNTCYCFALNDENQNNDVSGVLSMVLCFSET